MENKISVKDLRIGNKVIFSETGDIFTTDEISKTGLSVSNKNESTWIEIDQFEGIRLTPELLLEYGFELDNTGLSGTKDFLLKRTTGNDLFFRIYLNKLNVFFILINGFPLEIKYFHSLQNIIYDLCKKDLEKLAK